MGAARCAGWQRGMSCLRPRCSRGRLGGQWSPSPRSDAHRGLHTKLRRWPRPVSGVVWRRAVGTPHRFLLPLLPGVLFLQFGDETRRVHITHEISSMDTLHALIVHMFPQKLTMGMLKSPNTAILIKDESRNVFYELEDVR